MSTLVTRATTDSATCCSALGRRRNKAVLRASEREQASGAPATSSRLRYKCEEAPGVVHENLVKCGVLDASMPELRHELKDDRGIAVSPVGLEVVRLGEVA